MHHSVALYQVMYSLCINGCEFDSGYENPPSDCFWKDLQAYTEEKVHQEITQHSSPVKQQKHGLNKEILM